MPMFLSLLRLYGPRGRNHNPSEAKLAKAIHLVKNLQASDVVMRPYVDAMLPPRLRYDAPFATYVVYLFCGHKVYEHKPYLISLSAQFERDTFTRGVPSLGKQPSVPIKANKGPNDKKLHEKYAFHLEHWNAAREHFRLHGRPHHDPNPDPIDGDHH
ncbi:hypothetical protein OROMI_031309 [Orobanche minor]